MLITSINNEHIKEIMKLKNKKYRNETGLFLVETRHLVVEAYKAGLIEELILEQDEILPLGVKTTFVSKNVMQKLTDMENYSSVIAVVRKKKAKEIGEKVLVLDDIQDPGNLGTIIRSALAFNIDTIVLSPNTVDLYNPKVIRATQGMIFHINIVIKDIRSTLKDLKEKDYKILGTKVTNGIDARVSKTYSHFVLIIGNEGRGMSEELEDYCDEYLYIKMNDNCESLNASVAASILMYELDRHNEIC